MLLEVLGSVVVGLVLARLAIRLLGDRMPAWTLVLPTGLAGALLGAFITRSALGSGHLVATLAGAVVMATALLSLLLRPRRLRRSVHA
nr:hypothetical protein [Streptomyces sp. NA04227]